MNINKKWITLAVLVVLAVVATVVWQNMQKPALPEGIASGNGRLEATEVDITTKYPGRLASLNAKEGDNVKAGQILARMEVRELDAELRQAQAQVKQAQKQRKKRKRKKRSAKAARCSRGVYCTTQERSDTGREKPRAFA